MGRRRLPAVVVGGVCGTWLRWGATETFPVAPATFPVTTFVINMIGAVCIGVVVVLLLDRRPRPFAHALLGTGLLGGFTTFSAFTVESAELIRVHESGLAAVYVVATLVTGVVLAWISIVVTRQVSGTPRWEGS